MKVQAARFRDVWFTKPRLHSILGFWYCTAERCDLSEYRVVGQGRTPGAAFDDMKRMIGRAYLRVGQLVDFVAP